MALAEERRQPELPEQKDSALTVSQLTAWIKNLLEEKIGAVTVRGETSNVKYQPNGHIYLTLKDPNAQIRVAIFRQYASRIKFNIEDGMEIYVSGRVNVYAPGGYYSIIADRVDPKGVGALQLAFEQLKKKLEKEGLFDKARKRPLPPFPRRIAIVTSLSGAALQDMLNVIDKRFPRLHILIYPVRVQGEGAAQEIAAALNAINAMDEEVDIIIAGRGGGSIEDLWAFNEEAVARAIYASRIPVISAVGHETDYTIADFVADWRALTPTAAAETVAPILDDILHSLEEFRSGLDYSILNTVALREELLHKYRTSYAFGYPRTAVENHRRRLAELLARLAAGLQNRYANTNARVDALSQSLAFELRGQVERASSLLASLDGRLSIRPIAVAHKHQTDYAESLSSRLDSSLTGLVAAHEESLKRCAGLLESLSPLQVLSRGYSITFSAEGKAVRDAAEIAAGETIKTRFHKGEAISRVERTDPDPPTPTPS